jgi:CBS domain-containing protein
MLYLSQLIGASIIDQQDTRVGRIVDVLALTTQVGLLDPAYPSALLVEVEDDQLTRIPPTSLEHQENSWSLRTPIEQFALQAKPINEDEVRLVQEVLDKQIIDLVHKKAVRVNDLCFSDDWQILGIDKSSLGLVRRLAPFWLANAINQPTATNHTLIPWENIELIHSSQHREEHILPTPGNQEPKQPLTLSGHLGDLHPADIASIVHQVTVDQGTRIIERLDNETAADTMEEIDTERQAQILEHLAPERAASILHEMGPDEIADLLAQLPEDRKQELLQQLNPDDSEDVQVLLEYEADSAGGLMTTDYIVLNQTRTVQEALEAVRQEIINNDVRIAYVYCVKDETQDEHRPLGVVSIWDILIAQPSQPLQEIMESDIIKVQPDTDPRTVAETLAKYNLLAVPVINEDGFMEGVVTVDDALDVLLPTERNRKTRRMY